MRSRARLVACGFAFSLCGALCAQEKPTIEVSSASYGLNVNKHASGNATKYVKSACDTKRSCNFAVKNATSKNAGSVQEKPRDFDFVYRCGDKEKTGHITGESKQKIVLLTCTN
jgi:hypothetical protein